MTRNVTNEPQGQGGGPSIDIIELVLYGLGRFRWWIFPFALAGLCFGLYQALSVPNVYASQGKLLVHFGKRETLSPETAIQGVTGPATVLRAGPPMAEEIHLLLAPSFFEAIAREVGPERLLEPYDPTAHDGPGTPWWKRWLHRVQYRRFHGRWPEDPAPDPPRNTEALMAQAVNVLRRSLQLAQLGTTRLLVIQAMARSPGLARDIVQAAIPAAQERHREVYAAQFSPAFVTEQLERARTEHQRKDREFYEHRMRCGFFDIRKQKDQLLEERNETERRIDDLRLDLNEIPTDRELLEARRAETPPEIEELVEPRLEPNPRYQKLQQQLQEKDVQLLELSARYKRDSEAYRRKEEVILQDKEWILEQLETTEPEVVRGDPYTKTVSNPDYREIERQLEELDAREEKLRETIVSLERKNEKIGATLEDLMNCEPEHQTFQLAISEAQSRARDFQKAITDAEALALLDQDKELSNLQLVQPATYNPNKVAPQRTKEVFTGLAGGLAAWAAFAVLRQFLDSKVRFPRTVQRSLGLPVLGVIPEQRRWRKIGKRLRRRAA